MNLHQPGLGTQSSAILGLSTSSVTDSQQKFNGCFTMCQ